MKTLIKNPWIVTVNDNYDIIRNGFVLVEGTDIKEVGSDAQRMAQLELEADKVVEAGDKILMPGIVKAQRQTILIIFRHSLLCDFDPFSLIKNRENSEMGQFLQQQ